MTKDEIIEQIEHDSLHGALGFFLVTITEDDLEMYLPKTLYKKIKQEGRLKEYTTALADKMYDFFEEHPDWGFGNLLKAVLKEDGFNITE